MIIVQLAGGLGNQMFQYACGFALAAETGAQLALDHTFLENRSFGPHFTYRNYELNAFGIDRRISASDMPFLRKTPKSRRAAFCARLLAPMYTWAARPWHSVWIENDTVFDKSFFAKGPNQYIQGYFQDERYFASCREALHREFTFIPPLSEQDRDLAEHILTAEHAVSVHVRRGDYLTLGGGVFHGLCSPEYYKQAVDLLSARTGHPTFFVFSADDPQWAEEVFASFGCRFTVIGKDNVGERGYADMRLMSLCKHHVIANSSFSWWGAYLGAKPGQIVIAPKRWFAAESHKHKTLALPEWITLANG